MRAFALCVVAAIMVTGAFSAACTPLANGNLYGTAQSCTAYTVCGTALCTCVGSSTTSPNTCLGQMPNTTTCSKVQSCLHDYTMCIEQVPSTTAGCASLNTTLRMAFMTAASSGYSNSSLQRSCRNRVCTIMNGTSQTCAFGTDDANVCMFRPLATTAAPTTTTMAPMTNASTNATVTTLAPQSTRPAPANFTAALTALLVINGADFDKIRQNATAWDELLTALESDIASIFGLKAEEIYLIRVWVASLHVEFAISAAAGVSPSVLAQQLASVGQSTTWLRSVKAAYAKVSNETLTIQPITVTQTAAPGIVTPVPPTPAPSSISASNGVVSAVAAVVAVAAAVFAL